MKLVYKTERSAKRSSHKMGTVHIVEYTSGPNKGKFDWVANEWIRSLEDEDYTIISTSFPSPGNREWIKR